MLALKIMAALALCASVGTELYGLHPGGWGFLSNAGVVLAVVLWVLAGPAQQRRTAANGGNE
jgi:hypothetical protein